MVDLPNNMVEVISSKWEYMRWGKNGQNDFVRYKANKLFTNSW